MTMLPFLFDQKTMLNMFISWDRKKLRLMDKVYFTIELNNVYLDI